MHNTLLIDLLVEDGKAVGILAKENERMFIAASSNIIIATGGIGQVFNYTTNPKGAVGDGISAAYRAGAVIESMEMVQFHPTTLIPHYETDRLFLISEAVRGEGAILRNRMGEAFMKGVHPMADLAPRDIVTRAIYKELRKLGDSCVFLDAGSMTEKYFSERFPTIYQECVKFNINVPVDFIPVRPAQHYHMGGIKTDLNARTNIEGLYACGETASTGIHGANRLASNSVLECLVFGKRCALYINENFKPCDENKAITTYLESRELISYGIKTDYNQVKGFTNEIKSIMSLYAGAIRRIDGMLFALERINRIVEYIGKTDMDTAEHLELYSIAQVAKMIIESAIDRKENIGAHFVEYDE